MFELWFNCYMLKQQNIELVGVPTPVVAHAMGLVCRVCGLRGVWGVGL